MGVTAVGVAEPEGEDPSDPQDSSSVDLTPQDAKILVYAHEWAAYFGKWRKRIWTAHLSASGVSSALAAVVPFGLALLLHAPAAWRFSINAWTLVGSCLSLVLYTIDQNQRLPDRSILLKKCDCRLSLAIHRFEEGLLTREELSEELEDVILMWANFDGN